MRTVPQWRLVGDRFEICPAPSPRSRDFPEAPTNNAGEAMLAWHIRRGHYRDIRLDGFNLMAVGACEAASRTLFIEEGTDLPQREALQTIFAGRAGGRQARLVASVDEFKDVEFVPITFEMADDVAFWRVEIPDGRVPVRGRDSPSTLARPRVQTIDFARSELGSGQIATWGDSVTARTESFGFRWMGESRPSRYVRFDSRGPRSITFGDLDPASPGEAILYRSQQPSEVLALMLLPSLMQRMPREHTRGASFGSGKQAAVRDKSILHLSRTLQAEIAASLPSGRASGALLATALAIHLLQRQAFRSLELQNHRGGLPQASLRRVLQHIQAHLDQELPVTELAALAQMSPYHFSRLFKRSTGVSPHQYLLRQRIKRAKELLAEPRRRIAAVSYELGFPHQSHFTTIFRKMVGTTPREYQRQCRGN